MYNTQNNGLNGGLNGCGWICRQLNKVSALVGKIPFIGSTTVKLIAEVQKVVDVFDGNDNGLFRPVLEFLTPLEPTRTEETILNTWVDTKFTPFFTNMITALDTAFAGSVLQTKIAVANSQLAKMAIIREYYLVNETNGLSQNAINIRMQLINELFSVIDQLIAQNITASSSIVVITANQNDFNGLFLNSVSGQVYNTKQFTSIGTTPTGITPIAPIKTGGVFDTPVIKNDLTTPVKPTVLVNPAPSVTPVKQNPVSGNPVLVNPAVPVTPTKNVTENPTGINADKAFTWISRGLLLVTAIGVASQLLKKKKK